MIFAQIGQCYWTVRVMLKETTTATTTTATPENVISKYSFSFS